MSRANTPENQEKQAIKQYLTAIGCFHYHNLAGLGCYPGLADITAIKDGQVYQIEVKAGKGKQSERQKEFQIDWEIMGGVYILGGIDEVMQIIK